MPIPGIAPGARAGAAGDGAEIRPRRGDKVIEGEYEDLSDPGDDDERPTGR